MPVIRHECPAEEVRGSAINSRATKTHCPGTHVPTSVCSIWHAARLLSLAVGLADAGPSREPTPCGAPRGERRNRRAGAPSRSDDLSLVLRQPILLSEACRVRDEGNGPLESSRIRWL